MIPDKDTYRRVWSSYERLKNLFTTTSTGRSQPQTMQDPVVQRVPASRVPIHLIKALRSSNLGTLHIEEVENLINKSETVITEIEAQMDQIEAAISRKDSQIKILKEENSRLFRISEQTQEQSAREQTSAPGNLYREVGEARDSVFQPDGDVVDATSAVKELRRQLALSRAATVDNLNISK